MESNFKINGMQGLDGATLEKLGRGTKVDSGFADTLKQALSAVDNLQKESEVAQISYARGDDVELHDVLIKIEEAEIAFKTMMEVRSKLVEAYREVMRMGS